MTQLTVQNIPYITNTVDIFEKIAHLPWAIFLDSCRPHLQQGRYDIISALPPTTLRTQGEETLIQSQDRAATSLEDPFMLMKQKLHHRPQYQLPFTTGAMGYWSYDLGRRIEKLPNLAKADIDLPDMAIGIYNWSIVTDHDEKQSWLCTQDDVSQAQHQLIEELLTSHSNPMPVSTFRVTSPITSNLSKTAYQEAFNQIQAYINAGDCYQVNLAQRFQAKTQGDPWDAYKTLRQANPAPYATFMRLPGTKAILSLSPEQFIRLENGIATTKPIKGTLPRHPNPKIDKQLAAQLQASEKDRAENLMIVDLLRNDLSRNCVAGSVKVPSLFAIESFPAVHHLVSTITGKLAPNKHTIDLLREAFPGGSITGTPKIRAMEIIESLEPHRRKLYCGSMGYIDHNGNMNTNIVIRTLIHTDNNLYCYAGGAILADSTLEGEYQETFDKIRIILNTLK